MVDAKRKIKKELPAVQVLVDTVIDREVEEANRILKSYVDKMLKPWNSLDNRKFDISYLEFEKVYPDLLEQIEEKKKELRENIGNKLKIELAHFYCKLFDLWTDQIIRKYLWLVTRLSYQCKRKATVIFWGLYHPSGVVYHFWNGQVSFFIDFWKKDPISMGLRFYLLRAMSLYSFSLRIRSLSHNYRFSFFSFRQPVWLTLSWAFFSSEDLSQQWTPQLVCKILSWSLVGGDLWLGARLLRCRFTLGYLCWFYYGWWFGWHSYFIYYWFPWRVASFWSSEFFDSTIPTLRFPQAGMPTSISALVQFLIVPHFCAESNRFPSGTFWPVFNTAHVCWDYQIVLVYGWL